MSTDDVHPNEMNEPYDFDDTTSDAFLAGAGRDVDPDLADLLGDMRIAYTSTPPVIGAALAALMGTPQPASAPSFLSRRFEQMRSSMLAKIGSAAAVVVAATGGLAVAHALPAPVQDAVSHLGIGAPSHHSPETPAPEDATSTTTVDPTVTTMPADTTVPTDTTPTTTEPTDNHGGTVSGVAHDHSSDGCDHGAAVSNVASDGKSQNDAQDASGTDTHDASQTDTPNASNNDTPSGSCETTTTIAGTTTPTSTDNNQGDNNQGDSNPSNGSNQSGDNNSRKGDTHDGTPPTTVAGDTTPTSDPQTSGGDHGSNNSGDTNPSDSGSGNSSGSGSRGGN